MSSDEESELKYLAEIRAVRDQSPELFERIKHLPKKARSTRTLAPEPATHPLPALLTYFRRGKLDKFFLAPPPNGNTGEVDFFTAVKILKPRDLKEPRQSIPREFYTLLDQNKNNFVQATAAEAEQIEAAHRSDRTAITVLKRLRTREVRRCPQFTEEDENFVGRVIQLLEDGALPKRTTQKLADALKTEIQPLNILRILRVGIPREFTAAGPAQSSRTDSPREVILSSYLVESK